MSSDVASANVGTLERRLEECFRRACQQVADRHFEYAHELLTACVLGAPDRLKYVEALLMNLRGMSQGHKKCASGVLPKRILKAASSKVWLEVLRLGVEQLKTNPWHVATLREMATACAQLHFNEVELAYLKQALEADPRNADTSRHCGRSLARMGQFDQAVACWQRVKTLVPDDPEALRNIARISTEKIRWALGGHEVQYNVTKDVRIGVPTGDERSESELPHETTMQLNSRQLLNNSTFQCSADSTNQSTERACGKPWRGKWRELGLLIAGTALFMQLFPNVLSIQVLLFLANVLALVLLFMFRELQKQAT